MCRFDSWLFITGTSHKLHLREGLIYSCWDEQSIWNNPWRDHSPHCKIYYALWDVHDVDFYPLWTGSHLIVSADYLKICIDDVHLTSLEQCEYSSEGEEFWLEYFVSRSATISMFAMLGMNIQLTYFSSISYNVYNTGRIKYITSRTQFLLRETFAKMWDLNACTMLREMSLIMVQGDVRMHY